MPSCPFCPAMSAPVAENDLAYAIYDKYPVTRYHTLIIPKRHVASYFELRPDELDAIQTLLFQQQKKLQEVDSTITGFNIGVNVGEDAGQTIFHVHLHLIPRRKNDTEEPRGGVRGVIPSRQKY